MKTTREQLARTATALTLAIGAFTCASSAAEAAPTPSPSPQPTATAVIYPPLTVTAKEIKDLQIDSNADQDRLGMPTLTTDGKIGPQTRRALCIQRLLTGRRASLANPTRTEIQQLVKEDRYTISYKDFLISKTCQVLAINSIALSNGKNLTTKLIPVSTGDTTQGKITPITSTIVGFGRTGIHDSTLYPSADGAGNMIQPVYFKNNPTYAIHGSEAMTPKVTTARSNGCVRTSPADHKIVWEYVGGPITNQQDKVVPLLPKQIHVLG